MAAPADPRSATASECRAIATALRVMVVGPHLTLMHKRCATAHSLFGSRCPVKRSALNAQRPGGHVVDGAGASDPQAMRHGLSRLRRRLPRWSRSPEHKAAVTPRPFNHHVTGTGVVLSWPGRGYAPS